jgi:type IV secretion system protein VirB11
VPSHSQPELSESQARRASALKSALGPLTDLLDDPRVVEVMLNADGLVWVERVGEGVVRTRITVSAADADRMLRLVASAVLVELNPQSPSLSAKLPPPWGARLQAAIPPIVDAPVFALRKPARIVFSLEDYVSRGILTAAQRDALEFAVLAHDNILIGGGTGSGKTTFTVRPGFSVNIIVTKEMIVPPYPDPPKALGLRRE